MRSEPVYAVDTQALVYYLTEPDRLGSQARRVFDDALEGRSILIISAIVIAKLYYANRKWGWFDDFRAVYDNLRSQPYLIFVPFTVEDVLYFDADAPIPEMHDRIIGGIARRMNVPLLTADTRIVGAGINAIVW